MLVDLALYRTSGVTSSKYVIVPHVRNLALSEPRQIVRVVVQGETPSARVEIERVITDPDAPGRRRWNEEQFFATLATQNVPSQVRELTSKLRELALMFPGSVSLVWGTGRRGSMVVKRAGQGLIQINGSGQISSGHGGLLVGSVRRLRVIIAARSKGLHHKQWKWKIRCWGLPKQPAWHQHCTISLSGVLSWRSVEG